MCILGDQTVGGQVADLKIRNSEKAKLYTFPARRTFLVKYSRIVNYYIPFLHGIRDSIDNSLSLACKNEHYFTDGMAMGILVPLLDTLQLARIQAFCVQLDNVYLGIIKRSFFIFHVLRLFFHQILQIIALGFIQNV